MSIEKIVADYETVKEAYELGLRLETIFKWFIHSNNDIYVNLSEYYSGYKTKQSYSAPTAEEVPLPPQIKVNNYLYEFNVHYDAHPCFVLGYVEYYGTPEQSFFRQEEYFNCNLATAKTEYIVRLIKNVPEAKQWYIDNGYLKENTNDSRTQ